MKPHLIAKYDSRVPRYTSYPTAPHFGAWVDDATYTAWLNALPDGLPLSLYVHIPFCDTLCWFCGCQTTVVNTPAPVVSYLEQLQVEIRLVAAALRGCHPVQHIHLGGGSPSMLGPDQIAALFDSLDANFLRAPTTEIAVEVDPRGLSEDTVAAFADAGLTRASIGVQDTDPTVQRAVNRIQPHDATARAVRLLRHNGVRGLNIDLMYGLPHQTTAGTLATVEQILELEPDRVALFGYAHVPWMKKHQRLIHEADLPGAEARWEQFAAAAERLVGAGYQRVGLDHFARPDDDLARALEAGRLRRNFQGYTTDAAPALLGLGASAIGQLPQGYAQNHKQVRDYSAAIRDRRLPTARGVARSAEDDLRAAVIERLMCTLSVDLAEMAEVHGVQPRVFDDALRRLQEAEADGIVCCDGYTVTVPEPARPLVRAVAAVFDSYLATGEAQHARAV